MRTSVHTFAEGTSRLSFDLKRGAAQYWSATSARGRPEKCEGATGSLATLTSGRGPSLPRSIHHGSRLPAMSDGSSKSARCLVFWQCYRIWLGAFGLGED